MHDRLSAEDWLFGEKKVLRPRLPLAWYRCCPFAPASLEDSHYTVNQTVWEMRQEEKRRAALCPTA